MNNTNEMNKPSNPLLQKAFIPGETFTLPSKGLMYSNGEIDDTVRNGEIIVNPMVTYEELILKTPDRLLNGTGIEEVFKRCAPQILKPLDLFAKDLDYVLICLRKITYGDEISMEYAHDCDDESRNYSISLSEMMAASKAMDSHNIEKDYTITLPNEQVVKVHPPRYSQILNFFQSYDMDAETVDTKAVAAQVVTNTVGLIYSVDGITDKTQIKEWVEQIPSGYVRLITEVIDKATEWGPNLVSKKECHNCHKQIELEVSLNPISFFS